MKGFLEISHRNFECIAAPRETDRANEAIEEMLQKVPSGIGGQVLYMMEIEDFNFIIYPYGFTQGSAISTIICPFVDFIEVTIPFMFIYDRNVIGSDQVFSIIEGTIANHGVNVKINKDFLHKKIKT